MRLCQFEAGRIGLVRGTQVHDVTAIAARLGAHGYPLPRHDLLIAALDGLRAEIEALADQAAGRPLDSVTLSAPVANPGKLIAAPVNYLDHLSEAREDLIVFFQQKVEEIDKIGLFLKATSSLSGCGQAIRLGFPDRRTDHELELAVVIGRTARHVTPDAALAHVAGYCIGLDITLRGPEERSLRKSGDTHSVLGPWLVTADELGDPSGLSMHLDVNGERRQTANTRDLILSVPDLIALASRHYTLHPGDVLFTGTPAGVGEIRGGDVIDATIERIGSMRVRVEAAQ